MCALRLAAGCVPGIGIGITGSDDRLIPSERAISDGAAIGAGCGQTIASRAAIHPTARTPRKRRGRPRP
ncbi:hypothetical protein [Sphingomonas sp. PWP1-2]|uniref:hypothetical protein n=1 Tax=Sphingomonas sp. PWP1-2 TaxID=2804558 RepID=UPI003CFA6041